MDRRFPLLIALSAGVGLTTPAVQAQGSRATIRGVVFDSIRSLPLAGATIELVSLLDRARITSSTISDSNGRYALADVAPGHYIAGFIHPMLDSLGLGVTQRMIDIGDGASDVRFDLAVPSPDRLHRALCGRVPGKAGEQDSSGVVVGYVLSARTLAPLESAVVLAQWSEFTIGSAGMHHDVLTRVGAIVPGGWFAVCGVPAGTEVILRAVAGSDTSGAIQMLVPASRVARRTLFVADWTPADSLTAIRGWIRTEDGVPIAGAQVRIFGSDSSSVTDAEGAFALRGVPAGTRTLMTRAIGFVPDERAVDLTERHLPVTIGLTSIRNFLDTVHVRAARLDIANLVGFDSRRRTGGGRFFTADEIERLGAREVTDLFRHAPSLQLVAGANGTYLIRMRGDRGACTPALFLDGKQLVRWELADLNGIVAPNDIAGLEIYTPSMTPAEFVTREGCGTVLVWTKPIGRATRRQ